MSKDQPDTSKDPQAPIRTIRDGAISSSIWEQQGEDGPFYTAKVVRSYKDEASGEWRESNSYSENDLRRLADVARNTSDIMVGLRHDREMTRDVIAQKEAGHEQAQETQRTPDMDAQRAAFKQRRTQQRQPGIKRRLRSS